MRENFNKILRSSYSRSILKIVLIGLSLRLIIISLTFDYFNFYGFIIFGNLFLNGFDPWRVVELFPTLKIRNPFGYPAGFLIFIVVPLLLSQGNLSLFYFFFRLETIFCDLILGLYIHKILKNFKFTESIALKVFLIYYLNPVTIVWSSCSTGGNLMAELFSVMSFYYFLIFIKYFIDKKEIDYRAFALSYFMLGLGVAIKLFPIIAIFPYSGVSLSIFSVYRKLRGGRSKKIWILDLSLLYTYIKVLFLEAIFLIIPLMLFSLPFILISAPSYILTLIQFSTGSYSIGKYLGFRAEVEYYNFIYNTVSKGKGKADFLFSLYWILYQLFLAYNRAMLSIFFNPLALVVIVLIVLISMFIIFMKTFTAGRKLIYEFKFSKKCLERYIRFTTKMVVITSVVLYLVAPRLWINYMEWVIPYLFLFVGFFIDLVDEKRRRFFINLPILFILPAWLIKFTANGYHYMKWGSSGVYYIFLPVLRERGLILFDPFHVGLHTYVSVGTVWNVLTLIFFLIIVLKISLGRPEIQQRPKKVERYDIMTTKFIKKLERTSLKVLLLICILAFIFAGFMAEYLNTGEYFPRQYQIDHKNNLLYFRITDNFNTDMLSPFIWFPFGNGSLYIDKQKSFVVLDALKAKGYLIGIEHIPPVNFINLSVSVALFIDTIYNKQGYVMFLQLMYFRLYFDPNENTLFIFSVKENKTVFHAYLPSKNVLLDVSINRGYIRFDCRNIGSYFAQSFDYNYALTTPQLYKLRLGSIDPRVDARVCVSFVSIGGVIEYVRDATKVKLLLDLYIVEYFLVFLLWFLVCIMRRGKFMFSI